MANETSAEFVARMKDEQRKALRNFMELSSTKLLLSMVPATEPPEVLATLIDAAFECGTAFGVMQSTKETVQALVRRMREEGGAS